MSWHYLQEQAGESSVACCAGGEPWQPSKLKSIHGLFCCGGKLTDSYLDSLYGTMCEPSTATRGADGSTLSAAGSPARTSALPAKGQESTGNAPDCGASSRELSVKFDPAQSSWKTHLCLFDEVLPESSVILPRWGSMRAGVLSEHTTPAHLTSATESGLWPTPCLPGNGGTNGKKKLKEMLWPTPKASAAGPDFAKLDRSATGVSLQTAIAMWPTPTSSEHKYRLTGDSQQSKSLGAMMRKEALCAVAYPELRQSNTDQTLKINGFCGGSGAAAKVRENEGLTDEEKRSMLAGNGGQLNPDWVEWLMGWPIGWTDLKPLGTDRFRQWKNSHGRF